MDRIRANRMLLSALFTAAFAIFVFGLTFFISVVY